MSSSALYGVVVDGVGVEVWRRQARPFVFKRFAQVLLADGEPCEPVPKLVQGTAIVFMMPPMGGMARGGEGERRIKSVTTQVERDPNRRDLLGEAPAVLPGVIGDWAREEN
ncbi:hypothetical protein HMPREF3147_09780 [Corynebacterium sp. HMSC05D03]|nr:hypothetical protein HMPREF3147_09780 [Corynebacterium sp. HMSC05D03]